MKKTHSASDARRQINEAVRSYNEAVKEILAERGPLLPGAFQLRGTRCGKDNCKCTRGELHTTAVLVTSDRGKRRSYYLRPPERPETQRRVERYQRFRANCAELNRLHKTIQEAARQLCDSMKKSHEPQREVQQRKPKRTKKP